MGEEKFIVHVDADLEDLVPEFLENRQQDIGTMTEALTRQDFDVIRRLGHSMKGAGGGYGFEGITDIGRAIEEAARVQDAGEIRRAIDELASYLERVEVVYEEVE